MVRAPGLCCNNQGYPNRRSGSPRRAGALSPAPANAAVVPHAPVAPLPAHGARYPFNALPESTLKKAGEKSHMFLNPDTPSGSP